MYLPETHPMQADIHEIFPAIGSIKWPRKEVLWIIYEIGTERNF